MEKSDEFSYGNFSFPETNVGVCASPGGLEQDDRGEQPDKGEDAPSQGIALHPGLRYSHGWCGVGEAGELFMYDAGHASCVGGSLEYVVDDE